MSRGYIPAPSGHKGTLFLVVLGIIFLPAAINAVISILPWLLLIAAVVLGVTYWFGRRSIL